MVLIHCHLIAIISILHKFHDIKLTRDINVDPTRFTEIINNLLTNAIKYNTPGGKAGITASQDAKEATITIWDNGIGIDDSYQERIFQDFEQVGDPYRGKNSGIGLGLSIAKKLITLHGGELSLKSTLGKGSEFSFNIPNIYRSHEENIPPSPPINEDDFFKNHTFLVVDDDRNCH